MEGFLKIIEEFQMERVRVFKHLIIGFSANYSFIRSCDSHIHYLFKFYTLS